MGSLLKLSDTLYLVNKRYVTLALQLAHDAADDVGRTLYPTETVWIIRSGFAKAYPDIPILDAHDLADRAFKFIQDGKHPDRYSV